MIDDVEPVEPLVAALRRWADELTEGVPATSGAAALQIAARHRRSRRATLAAAAALVLVVAGIAWGAAYGRDGSRRPVPATPDTAPPVVDSTPVSVVAAGAGPTAGIDVAVEIPAQALVGTRVPIRATVTNRGPNTVYWQAGGCAIPVEVTVGPEGATDLDAGLEDRERPGWSGDFSDLGEWIDDAGGAEQRTRAQPVSAPGWRGFFCTAESRMEAFAPGDQLVYDGGAEIRVAPGPLVSAGTSDVVVAFTAYAVPGDYAAAPLEAVVATAPLTVVDHPGRRATSVEGLADAARDDGRLATWLATTAIPGRSDLTQDQSVRLTWWRNAWELWVSPRWGTSDVARLRFDPVTLEVVDARILHDLGPADDEPGAIQTVGHRPDTILDPPSSAPLPTTVVDPVVVRIGDQFTVTAPPGIGDACGDIAQVYAVTDAGSVESGALLGAPDGVVTWATPPAGSPMTIPPCGRSLDGGSSTYTVPELAPGDYLICLTRQSDACASFEVIS